MLAYFLRNISFLMVSLLLVSCASQKSINPFNVADVNPELNSVQPTQKLDNLIAEKSVAVPISQPIEVEKEKKTVKATGLAPKQAPVYKTEPVPEKVSITSNVQFDIFTSGPAVLSSLPPL